jgi:hypothetical protein
MQHAETKTPGMQGRTRGFGQALKPGGLIKA